MVATVAKSDKVFWKSVCGRDAAPRRPRVWLRCPELRGRRSAPSLPWRQTSGLYREGNSPLTFRAPA